MFQTKFKIVSYINLMRIFLHIKYMRMCVYIHTHSRVSVIIVMHSSSLKFTLDSKHNKLSYFKIKIIIKSSSKSKEKIIIYLIDQGETDNT